MQVKKGNNQKRKRNGFTLLETMIVLLVVAVLLMITLPNIQQKEKIIRTKGCESLLSVIDSQILLFEIENDRSPDSIQELIDMGFLKTSQLACPDGKTVSIQNGQAVAK